jgi:TRAP-type mannitol/chloroaromatic compound transport system permease small subunit
VKPLFKLASWLVLPLALLLCAQWPLRELVQAWSRETNDLAQVLFALYAAVAVTAASAAEVHLAAHRPAADGRPPSTARVWALAACVLPWAAFVLWSAWPSIWASWLQLEKFPDTLNPGYFLIRSAAWLLALLALLHALARLLRPRRTAPAKR